MPLGFPQCFLIDLILITGDKETDQMLYSYTDPWSNLLSEETQRQQNIGLKLNSRTQPGLYRGGETPS